MKKALSLILALGLLLGMMPMQAFASEETGQVTEDKGVTEFVDVHEHEYSTAVTAPNCTEQGYTTYTCACGDSYVDDYADATGHSYEDGVCTVCGVNVPTQDETTGEDEILPEETTSGSEAGVPVAISDEEQSAIGGAFGENLTWTLDEATGTLTISGSGAMTNYSTNSTPWADYADSISKIVVNEGITTLSACGFKYFTVLTEVSLPDSLQSIGYECFLYCPALKQISIPENVTTIGSYAFEQCHSLESVVIPERVTAIYGGVFNHCKSLKSVTIPASVKEIGNGAFSNCTSLKDVYYGSNEKSWNSISISSYNDYLRNATIHYTDPCAVGHTEVVDPGTPATCTEPGMTEGKHCSVCSEVLVAQEVIPGGHTVQNEICTRCSAYGTCGENLTWTLDETTGTLTISGTGEMRNYDHDDGEYTPWYSLRESITSLVVEDGVTTIGNYAFATCKNLAEVSIADSVESFGAYAFQGCNSLKAIEIPEGQGRIWAFTFAGCSSLTSITIPDGVSTIGANAFAGSGITSITIPDSVTSIGNRAFDGSGLVEVRVGKGVRSLGARAFAFCSSLKSVWFTGNAPETGEANVFARSGGTVYYPDHLDSWTESARTCICRDASWVPYNVCDKGHSYDANNTCTNCGAVKPFDSGKCGDNLIWEYDGNGTITITGTGSMYSYFDKQDRPWDAYTGDITTVIVEEGVTSIGNCAFIACRKLTDVSLPETLTLIEAHGFSYCDSLEEIRLPDGLRSIERYALSSGGLKSIHLGAAVAVIGDLNPFSGCSAMQQITVAEENPFFCAVDNVLFTKDMKTLVCYPSGLNQERYTVPDGVTAIGGDSFRKNDNIKTVVLPDSVTVLEEGAFSACYSLQEAELPFGLQRIEDMVFDNTSLQNLTIPASVTYIGHLALCSIDELEYIVFEGDVPEFHSGVFGYENGRNNTETTAYYPGDNTTWTEDKLQNYGGKITWIPYTAEQEFAITKQPVNGEAVLGERYCVEVKAIGEGLTYQWFFRNEGATKWSKSSVTDNTYDDVMTKARAGREVYCVITDANGEKLESDHVFLIAVPGEELAIVTQPNDASAKLGENFCVTVEAQGDELKYKWYWRQAGAENWNVSGVKDNTYDDVMTSARHNREVYCVITDAWGNSVNSEIATITGEETVKLAITRQPESQTVKLGEMFNVTFDAEGDGLKYQWYFRKVGTEKWYTSAQKDNCYDDVMTVARHDRELYCVVTDAWGNKVATEPIVTIMASHQYDLAILTQPENASAKMDEMFCVTVEAQGDGLKYQWYWRNVGSETWNVSGQRDNTYDDVMTKARHNREVKCVITDLWGNKVESKIATITGTPTVALAIVTQPTDASAAMGKTFCVTVEAQGDGLTYTWYFRNPGSKSWSKSGVKDNTYDDVMTKARAGREVYCVVTDALGNSITTDHATIKVIK